MNSPFYFLVFIFSLLTVQAEQTINEADYEGQIRVACVGDSITKGGKYEE